MRIDTVHTKVYTFKELDQAGKDKAIEDQREFIFETWDATWIIEDETARLESMGYSDPDISYSGFNSQGDGASFTCRSIDLWSWITFKKLCTVYKPLKKYIESGELTGSIDRTNNHYSHSRTVAASISDDMPGASVKLCDLINRLEKTIDQDCETQSDQIYKALESAWDYELEDKSIIETIQMNGYEYYSDGLIYIGGAK